MSMKRIKLLLNTTASDDRNRKAWFLFDSEKCRIVSDLSYLISKRFGLMQERIELEMDKYVLPPLEKIDIIRDNDSLTVNSVITSQMSDLTNDKAIKQNGNTKTATERGMMYNNVNENSDSISEEELSSTSSSSTEPSSSEDESNPAVCSKEKISKPVILKPKKVPLKQNGGHNIIRNQSSAKVNNSKKNKLNVQNAKQSLSVVQGNSQNVPNTTTKTTKSRTGSGIHIRFNDSDSSENDNEVIVPERSTGNKAVQEMDTTEHGHFIPLDLTGFVQPKIGDRLKYILLELSSDYTPTFSPYKEGIVMSANISSQTVTLQLSEETVGFETKRIVAKSSGKFSLSKDVEEAVETFVEIGLSEMIEPMIFLKE